METETKTTLGTRWNWTAYTKDGRTIYVIQATSRTYRIAKEGNHWRADVGSIAWWEALDSTHYRTPQGAARAIIRADRAHEQARSVERLAGQSRAMSGVWR